ncbi:activator of Hsp90 ATPase-like protein [Paramagnetospirillum caucaseum]|uniref:Activator of Hsp90 ATPase-like protein n=1 Tax=Paramagnetospirillum caucaseum TaxID=1244869 RepID=M2ZVS0_9PROT|nr:SRPBCC family protein [Paramagnetospirillum caucaseum]EME71492.1 activator of Hsp90 ATPase-like protein [Paramagnetospirillum caucaseum]
MSPYSHTSFIIERTLPGSPAHAFRFFSEPELKRRWTSCHPDWRQEEASLDFRNGGGEISRLRAPDGRVHEFRAHYLDIVAARHIVYAFTMRTDGELVSSSMVTVEFTPSPAGTAMLYTEQAVFLRGEPDIAPRREGTGHGFDRLVAEVERSRAVIQ